MNVPVASRQALHGSKKVRVEFAEPTVEKDSLRLKALEDLKSSWVTGELVMHVYERTCRFDHSVSRELHLARIERVLSVAVLKMLADLEK
jgi:hypothetical protein